jgi:hypothetical protein
MWYQQKKIKLLTPEPARPKRNPLPLAINRDIRGLQTPLPGRHIQLPLRAYKQAQQVLEIRSLDAAVDSKLHRHLDPRAMREAHGDGFRERVPGWVQPEGVFADVDRGQVAREAEAPVAGGRGDLGGGGGECEVQRDGVVVR